MDSSLNEEREKRAVELGAAAKFKLEYNVRFIFLFAFIDSFSENGKFIK